MEKELRTKQRHWVDKKLKRKLYFYLAIFYAMLIVSVYDVLMQYLDACRLHWVGLLVC